MGERVGDPAAPPAGADWFGLGPHRFADGLRGTLGRTARTDEEERMLGGVTGVLALVAGVLLVLLIAGVAVLLHVRQRRRPPQESPRTSWPRPAAQQETQRQEAQQPSWWREADAPQQDAAGATTRLPLTRGPADRSPIDSARAQRDPETVITRRDPPDGSLFRPPDPPPR